MYFNAPRACQLMDSAGVDVLIATSTVNVTYFTDYFCWMDPLFKDYMTSPGAADQRAAIYGGFARDGKSCLVVDPFMACNATDVWVDDLCTFAASGFDLPDDSPALPPGDRRLYASWQAAAGDESATAALITWLRQQGLQDARIGIEMTGLRPDAQQGLRRALPGAELKDSSNLIRIIRMVKTAAEIDLLRTAAQISEDAGMAVLEMVKPGVAIDDLIQRYRELVAARGADFDHYAYSVRGNGIATRVDYVFTTGSYHFIDYGCIYHGYFSDTGLTLAVGQPGAELVREYEALSDCQARAVAAVRPGTRSSEVANQMHSALADAGITGEFPHGHGVGLEIRDYPIIVPDNGLRIRDDCIDLPSDLPLEQNMVVNLEVGSPQPGRGSTQFEQTILITDDGCEPLIPHDRTEIFVSQG